MQYTQTVLSDKRKLFYAWFSAMFTRVDVLIYADDFREDLVDIAEKIENEILRIESFANRFDDKSELSCINSNAYANEYPVSVELFRIITECLLYNSKTGGCFDITINSLNAFRLGIENICLNSKQHSIKFRHSDVKLDLSGFIKGYSLRSVQEILKNECINNALINVGNSSILAIGNHPHGKGWKICPPGLNTTNDCVLFNECLTTSGNVSQTTWPTLNPLTGEIITKSQSVSVVTRDPAIGEALSTALYVVSNNEKEMILNQFDAKEIIW